MKTSIQQLPMPKRFPGFRLSIDVETERDARILAAMWGIDRTMAEHLKSEGYGISGVTVREIQEVIKMLGVSSEDALRSFGIDRVGEGKQ